MPHVSSSAAGGGGGGGGDDLGSEDEVKVFKDEGEDEKRSSENLTEEKSSLIDLTESEVRAPAPLLHLPSTSVLLCLSVILSLSLSLSLTLLLSFAPSSRISVPLPTSTF